MPALTWFLAKLPCPYGGIVSKDDTSTGMSNKLVLAFEGAFLRVGDRIEATEAAFANAFVTVRRPEAGAPICLLHDWTCAACGRLSWAEIVFDDGIIVSIAEVGLTQASLRRAHLITDNLYDVFELLVGVPLWENGQLRPGFVERLAARLPLA